MARHPARIAQECAASTHRTAFRAAVRCERLEVSRVARVLAIALALSLGAGPQVSRAEAPQASAIVVDGADWQSASGDERLAFLVGIANLIVAEGAYAKRNGEVMPPVSDRIVKAVEDMKLPEIEARISRWYEAHPDRLSMPVMGVIWQSIVRQQR